MENAAFEASLLKPSLLITARISVCFAMIFCINCKAVSELFGKRFDLTLSFMPARVINSKAASLCGSLKESLSIVIPSPKPWTGTFKTAMAFKIAAIEASSLALAESYALPYTAHLIKVSISSSFKRFKEETFGVWGSLNIKSKEDFISCILNKIFLKSSSSIKPNV